MRCKVTVDEDYKLSVAGNERTFALDGIVKIVLEGGGQRGSEGGEGEEMVHLKVGLEGRWAI